MGQPSLHLYAKRYSKALVRPVNGKEKDGGRQLEAGLFAAELFAELSVEGIIAFSASLSWVRFTA